MVSEYKKKKMKYGAIIGAAVGTGIFIAAYMMNPSFVYILFIPIGAAMGWATQYVKDEDFD
ncbi:MAG: hypothetical protein FWC44_02005 [Methanomassiliicoccaceae archaeon]|nr:hypothetical protein [Methanomassiliicoccaceae archaeon]